MITIELEEKEVALVGAVLASEAGRYIFKPDQTDEDREIGHVLTLIRHKFMEQAIKQVEGETNEYN